MTTQATTIEKNINDKFATLVACKTIKGTTFVGVRNYENKQGEISNQTFLVGINYGKLLENDLKTLQAFDIAPLIEKYDKEIVTKAYTELISSLVKRTASEMEKDVLRELEDVTIKRSDAQSDAYVNVAKGLKAKDNDLYIYGLSVKKTVLVSVEYPPVKSQLKTIVKNEITKLAKLRGGKYKQFKLGNIETLKIQGFEI